MSVLGIHSLRHAYRESYGHRGNLVILFIALFSSLLGGQMDSATWSQVHGHVH